MENKYKADQELYEEALLRIQNKEQILYGMSGKMGSGKDTIGEKIAKDNKLYKYDIIHISFATPIRNEIAQISDYYNQGMPLEELSELFKASEQDILKLSELLKFDDIFGRTDNARIAIQFWGTDVRRKQDENYWVNKAVEFIIEQILANKSVYVTDARFKNEVEAILDLGGRVIRLEVPEEVRVDRIIFRDGIKPTRAHLDHISETGLDEYEFSPDCVFDGREDPAILSENIVKYILRRDF